MPKIPSKPIDKTKNSDGSPVPRGALRWWECPLCKRKHFGMKLDSCHNEKCKNFGKVQ